ncbi:MAG: hypothetical protein AAFY22_03870 [Pseudomonadota bacterium]
MGIVLALSALVGVSACETARQPDEPTISIPYDPYNFDPDELFDQANTYCAAYGRKARYVDETIDPTSVRWRYRHFACE